MKNSEFTKKIFGEIVTGWYQNHENNMTWKHYTSKGNSFIRRRILEYGRADFSQTFKENGQELELSADDKAILYCYYCMQFHYMSSLYIYYLEKEILRANFVDNKHLIFIDIGCGPLTSCLAFLRLLDKSDKLNKQKFLYVGVDKARAMLERGKILLTELGRWDKKHESYYFWEDFKLIPKNLEKLVNVQIEQGSRQAVIINLCYFLAAHNLNIDEIVAVLEQIFEYFKEDSVCIIYQNPPHLRLNQNWKKVRQRLKSFYNQDRHNQLSVTFDDETGAWLARKRPTRTVYYDFLYNRK